ncbi:MAG: hypothetical protein LC742_08690 [Acidobacteria bacterium]|nr:hypothetical protein [Acidobacteriota bacterium]
MTADMELETPIGRAVGVLLWELKKNDLRKYELAGTSTVASVQPYPVASRKAFADKIVAEVRKCACVHFKYRGRDPKDGLDCVGLLLNVARNLRCIDEAAFRKYGADYDFRQYGWELKIDQAVKMLGSAASQIPTREATIADVYLLGLGNAPTAIRFITDVNPLTTTFWRQGCFAERVWDVSKKIQTVSVRAAFRLREPISANAGLAKLSARIRKGRGQ